MGHRVPGWPTGDVIWGKIHFHHEDAGLSSQLVPQLSPRVQVFQDTGSTWLCLEEKFIELVSGPQFLGGGVGWGTGAGAGNKLPLWVLQVRVRRRPLQAHPHSRDSFLFLYAFPWARPAPPSSWEGLPQGLATLRKGRSREATSFHHQQEQKATRVPWLWMKIQTVLVEKQRT